MVAETEQEIALRSYGSRLRFVHYSSLNPALEILELLQDILSSICTKFIQV